MAYALARRTSVTPERRPGEDHDAVVRAKQGDEDAIRYLYVRFAGNVYGYACSLLHDEHDAEDLTQQVFARLLRALSGFDPRDGAFVTWLLRITRNLAIDEMRRRSARGGEHWDVDEVEVAAPESPSLELSDTLRSALAELPGEQAEVIVLRHLAGYSPGEIAERLGRSEDSIHGLHHRARRRLRAHLAEAGAVPRTLAA